MTDLITCIVPVYNGERYLTEALDSIVAQTYGPVEIIIVDDGSTDATLSVAAAYAASKPNVRVITQANAGPAAARNRGIAEARGRFIGFLDADDLWHGEKLSRQLARFQARPDLDYCVHYMQNFWVEELKEEEERMRDHPRSKPVPGYVTQTLLARAAAFERVGPFDPTLNHCDSMDWFLRARALGLGEELIPDVLAYRRMHENNLSRQHAQRSLEGFFTMLKESLDQKRAQALESSNRVAR